MEECIVFYISMDEKNYQCDSIETFNTLLQKQLTEKDTLEVWCTYEQKTYPCISLIIHNHMAVVHYFAEEDDVVYVSLGDVAQDGIFEITTESQRFDIATYQLISLEKALTYVEEFFENALIPDAIEWEEL